MKLSEELRNKQSRDNRDLLDRAADRIDELEAMVASFELHMNHPVFKEFPSIKSIRETRRKRI